MTTWSIFLFIFIMTCSVMFYPFFMDKTGSSSSHARHGSVMVRWNRWKRSPGYHHPHLLGEQHPVPWHGELLFSWGGLEVNPSHYGPFEYWNPWWLGSISRNLHFWIRLRFSPSLEGLVMVSLVGRFTNFALDLAGWKVPVFYRFDVPSISQQPCNTPPFLADVPI